MTDRQNTILASIAYFPPVTYASVGMMFLMLSLLSWYGSIPATGMLSFLARQRAKKLAQSASIGVVNPTPCTSGKRGT